MHSTTFQIETLGCKINQYDSQRLAKMLETAGLVHLEAHKEGSPPDIWIINTCTVTHVADRKARRIIRQKKRENPQSMVYVTGCYAAVQKEKLERIPEIDGIYGVDEWGRMLKDIQDQKASDTPPQVVSRWTGGIDDFRGRTRSYIKIQDGCDAFCTYCVVPHARGKPRSRPLDDALEEAERMIYSGCREIVLSGIHLGLYGTDLTPRRSLAYAVEAFAVLSKDVRIRLSSLEGPEADRRLLTVMSEHPNICPHLHLPLQSGDAGVLRKMGRQYSPEEYLQVIENVRQYLDEPAISTDVMVGFPGETEQAFYNTLSICEKAGFSRLHVFPFSPRPHTPAAGFTPKADPAVTKERTKALLNLSEKLQRIWAEKFRGKVVRVLFETVNDDGTMTGYTDRYVEITQPADESAIGTLQETLYI